MSNEGTVRVSSDEQPVKGIRAEVMDGPDVGAKASATGESLTIGTADGNDLVLSDPTVSRIHLTLGRRADRILVTDHGSTNGTLAGPAQIRGGTMAVRAGTDLRIGETTLRVDDGRVVMVDDGPEALGDLRGRNPRMRLLMGTIGRVAASEVSVLVTGESGTGKELIARSLHDHSERREQPFVTLDCAALTPTLFASELFGHERGAFTGADRRHIGACERASGGTLFLDEIGELPPDIQGMLLGVLERQRFRRVGGREDIPVDLRIVAATNRDLHAEVNRGSFRLDLFYRIAIVRLEVPPLRERPDDVPLLIQHFLDEAGHGGRVEEVFDEEALARLVAHSWPGNVRELRNVVFGSLALGSPVSLLGPAAPDGDADITAAVLTLPFRQAKRRVVEEFEQRYIRHNLSANEGNIRQTARETQMDRSYLMELMKRHGMR